MFNKKVFNKKDVLKELHINVTNREKVTTVDIEGDPYNGYWYVCEECHGPVNWKDEVCPHCGWRLDWDG